MARFGGEEVLLLVVGCVVVSMATNQRKEEWTWEKRGRRTRRRLGLLGITIGGHGRGSFGHGNSVVLMLLSVVGVGLSRAGQREREGARRGRVEFSAAKR